MYSFKTKEGKTQPEHYLYCVRGKEVTNSLNQSNVGISILVATPASWLVQSCLGLSCFVWRWKGNLCVP